MTAPSVDDVIAEIEQLGGFVAGREDDPRVQPYVSIDVLYHPAVDDDLLYRIAQCE
jgi:hypothetical protein